MTKPLFAAELNRPQPKKFPAFVNAREHQTQREAALIAQRDRRMATQQAAAAATQAQAARQASELQAKRAAQEAERQARREERSASHEARKATRYAHQPNIRRPRITGLGWSVFNPRPDERDMVPREMILNDLRGVFLASPIGSKFYIRTDDTLARFAALQKRADATGKIKGDVYRKVLQEHHIDRVLEQMEKWKQEGKGHTGVLASAKTMLEALEAMVRNMEEDKSARAYDEQLAVSQRMFNNALGMYNRDETTAAMEPYRPTGDRYQYYGYRPVLHVRGNKPPVMKGLGMFRLGDIDYPTFLNRFAAVVDHQQKLRDAVGILGDQAVTAYMSLINQPLGSGRTEGGGLLSGIVSIRFDMKHYPGKMDMTTLNALETKLKVLDGVVASMQQNPPAPTQDGENERTIEYMKSEVDRLAAEKASALEAAAKWGWLYAPLGISWTYWGLGSAAVAALGGLSYALGRSGSR